jgi:hypothetical protein
VRRWLGGAGPQRYRFGSGRRRQWLGWQRRCKDSLRRRWFPWKAALRCWLWRPTGANSLSQNRAWSIQSFFFLDVLLLDIFKLDILIFDILIFDYILNIDYWRCWLILLYCKLTMYKTRIEGMQICDASEAHVGRHSM